MYTIENRYDLCKGVLEAVAGMMVPGAASCGRDTQVCVRVGAHQKNVMCHTLLALGGGVAGHINIAMLFLTPTDFVVGEESVQTIG